MVQVPDDDAVVALDRVEEAGRPADEEAALPGHPLGVLTRIEVLDQRKVHAQVVGAAVVVEQPSADIRSRRVEIVDRGRVEDPVGERAVVGGAVPGEALDQLEFGTANPVPQDLSQRTFFHKRSDRDGLVDWTWPAVDIERFIRALSDPYPNAYTYFRGQRVRLIAAHVSRCTYGGTPGRVFIEEDGGMVIVAGAQAYRGESPGLVLDVVRTDDGVDHDALAFFRHGGGYLTGEP